MTTTPRDTIRQAADDATLTHTGRSIGDLASERVADAILAALDHAGYTIVRSDGTAGWLYPVRDENGDPTGWYVDDTQHADGTGRLAYVIPAEAVDIARRNAG